jgi:uncharacterized membrane protein YeaQ/YmgE (transglycosylase-associated protein family)
MNTIKISIWFLSSIIASISLMVVFLWLSGYTINFENEYNQSEGINLAYVIALPIIPVFVGAKLAQDWGPRALNKKLEWFALINAVTNTILLIAIQLKYDFDLTKLIYLFMVWLCTFIVYQIENELRASA